MRNLLLLAILSLPSSAMSFYTDIGFLYLSDSLSATSESSISRMYGDFSLGMDIVKGGDIVIGWSVAMITATDVAADETTYSTMDMGPKVGYFIDRAKAWSVAFTYNLKANATYTSGGAEATWRGTSYKLELGYAPKISDSSAIGIKLNYYSVNLTEEFTGGTNFAEIANSRTVLWPSLYYSFQFN